MTSPRKDINKLNRQRVGVVLSLQARISNNREETIKITNQKEILWEGSSGGENEVDGRNSRVIAVE
jgi:hypothetical protein